jgi:multimeric flavodoxin WrbA
MNVLALNGSPHRSKGGTASIMGPFLEGMESAGAQVDRLDVYALDIKPCRGCHSCWFRTPGECAQDDDMQQVYPKMVADVLVLGTPVYVDGMTGAMKTLIDRLLPLGEGGVELRDGRCRHVLRETAGSGKLVLVSTCGYPELVTFDPLVAHVKAIAAHFGRQYAGALLRPYPHLLGRLKEQGLPVDDVYHAAREAGQALVEQGHISAEALARVSKAFVSPEQYVGRS